MYSQKDLQNILSILLLVGVLLSLCLVMTGGIMYLVQHGKDSMSTELIRNEIHHVTVTELWHQALSFTPLGIIELGLLALVATQILRVALLTAFYITIRDLWFIFFSMFILIVLIYSSFLRY